MGAFHAIKSGAEHLHRIEAQGRNASTPLIAMGEVLLLLIPVVTVVLALTFIAYYVIG